MKHNERIVIDSDVLVGKPVVKGTRLSVDFLLGLLGQGWSESEILRNYPGLEREDLLACWSYAAEALGRGRSSASSLHDNERDLKRTTQTPIEPLKPGTVVRILNSGFHRAWIVGYRGPLGPDGARVYQVLVVKKPRMHIEVLEDQLEVLDSCISSRE